MEARVIAEERTLVALYLRKSQGDEETALTKHRARLTELIRAKGWDYVEYEEIKSGDRISDRPQFIRVLEDMADGRFHAVVVNDIDRLGRGDISDQALIRRAFEGTGTLIVTPETTYDLDNDDSVFQVDVKSLLARYELKQITKRLRQGKYGSAKQGRWPCSKAPYPYRYDRETGRLVVDPEKLKWYRWMLEQLLSGRPAASIALELNRLGLPGPGANGNGWYRMGVVRVLLNEAGLGRVVYGKHRGNSRKQVRAVPRSEWVVVDNAHPAIKSVEEHARVVALLEETKAIPVGARAAKYALSGLVRCARCGKSMGFQYHKDIHGVWLMECRGPKAMYHPHRTCDNRGCKAEVVELAVNEALRERLDELVATDRPQGENVAREQMLEQELQTLAKLQAGRERILDMYRDGDISREEKAKRLAEQDRKIGHGREVVEQLRLLCGTADLTADERRQRLQAVLSVWENLVVPEMEKNRLMRQIVAAIKYKREGQDIEVEVILK